MRISSPTFALCVFHFPFLLLSSPSPISALAFPDTSRLMQEYRVISRQHGLPTLFARVRNGDSASLALEWERGRPVSARLEQEEEFAPERFEALADEFGAGAAWHEFDDGKRPYQGLVQQWHLQGYGKETGWLGSGIHRGRYFLIFRATPPSPMVKVDSPLALRPSVSAFLDTSSRWLKVACSDEGWPKNRTLAAQSRSSLPKNRPAPAGICYRSGEDSRLRVKIDGTSPLRVRVRLEEGESPTLREIRKAVQTVPDAAQAEYAEDLSRILFAEAQIFLAKLGQRLPALFNWPSWQLQGLPEGRVASREFLALVRSENEPGEFLPALRLEARTGQRLRMAINLYYRGTIHLEAEAIP